MVDETIRRVAVEYGFKPCKNSPHLYETDNDEYHINVGEKILFMRDSSLDYHGYTFHFIAAPELRKMLDLIKHKLKD